MYKGPEFRLYLGRRKPKLYWQWVAMLLVSDPPFPKPPSFQHQQKTNYQALGVLYIRQWRWVAMSLRPTAMGRGREKGEVWQWKEKKRKMAAVWRWPYDQWHWPQCGGLRLHVGKPSAFRSNKENARGPPPLPGKWGAQSVLFIWTVFFVTLFV